MKDLILKKIGIGLLAVYCYQLQSVFMQRMQPKF